MGGAYLSLMCFSQSLGGRVVKVTSLYSVRFVISEKKITKYKLFFGESRNWLYERERERQRETETGRQREIES